MTKIGRPEKHNLVVALIVALVSKIEYSKSNNTIEPFGEGGRENVEGRLSRERVILRRRTPQ